jgi:hypothetical protein
MKIQIFPTDVVKRCLWDSYVSFIVGSEKEAERILKENKEFEISERDAIVIGLLKVIETDNLIHRFNDYFIHFLNVKSIKEKTDILIKKKSIEIALNNFIDKFPDYWEAPANYLNSLKDLNAYISDLRSKIENLDITKMSIQNIQYEFYSSNSVRKLLNFNNY